MSYKFNYRDAWQVILKDMYTAFKNVDPIDEEPYLVVSSSNQSGEQTSCSMTADLVSQSFPLCHFSFPQGGENTAQELEQVMRNMQVVDLTIKRVQPIENSINYLQFIFFDLNLGNEILSILVEMFEYVDFHILDQLDCCHYRIDDPELEIVGILNGELIVLEMRLNLPDDWKPSARMVINHLENDDVKYLNFARSAFKQLNQDLPQEYSNLIKVC
ncbi:Hypothetical protein CINCED_3A019003 [Cinara cedri]|uniref:Uncharacterized protein n=1 Tax=Cinara cedri TaxID=506608 RepID=A0A5E4NJX6_9HEMI|nr:Hypothetical protein CINCED_3A019003 [Cinara cedri]